MSKLSKRALLLNTKVRPVRGGFRAQNDITRDAVVILSGSSDNEKEDFAMEIMGLMIDRYLKSREEAKVEDTI